MSDGGHAALEYGRRSVVLLAVGAMASAVPRESAAQTALVPSGLQAALLAKVAFYDRHFAARAIDLAKLLLVAKADDAESNRAVTAIKSAFGSLATVGGLPHDEEVTQFTDAATIAKTCNSHRISIVYFGSGFANEIPAIRAALTSLDVLSVGADPDYVPKGIVLGFRLVSGDAKLLLNRGQARAQNVDFGARMLRRMTIYE